MHRLRSEPEFSCRRCTHPLRFLLLFHLFRSPNATRTPHVANTRGDVLSLGYRCARARFNCRRCHPSVSAVVSVGPVPQSTDHTPHVGNTRNFASCLSDAGCIGEFRLPLRHHRFCCSYFFRSPDTDHHVIVTPRNFGHCLGMRRCDRARFQPAALHPPHRFCCFLFVRSPNATTLPRIRRYTQNFASISDAPVARTRFQLPLPPPVLLLFLIPFPKRDHTPTYLPTHWRRVLSLGCTGCAPSQVPAAGVAPPHRFLLLFLICSVPPNATTLPRSRRAHADFCVRLSGCTDAIRARVLCRRCATPPVSAVVYLFRLNTDHTHMCRQHAELCVLSLGCTDALRARFSYRRCHLVSAVVSYLFRSQTDHTPHMSATHAELCVLARMRRCAQARFQLPAFATTSFCC
jgi:hypothetical protein